MFVAGDGGELTLRHPGNRIRCAKTCAKAKINADEIVGESVLWRHCWVCGVLVYIYTYGVGFNITRVVRMTLFWMFEVGCCWLV